MRSSSILVLNELLLNESLHSTWINAFITLWPNITLKRQELAFNVVKKPSEPRFEGLGPFVIINRDN